MKNVQVGNEFNNLRSGREDDNIGTNVQESTEKIGTDSVVAHSDDGKSGASYWASTSESDSNLELNLDTMHESPSTGYPWRSLRPSSSWNVTSFTNANHVYQQLKNLHSGSFSQLTHKECNNNTISVSILYLDVVKSKHSENWLEALQSEFVASNKMGTWHLVSPP